MKSAVHSGGDGPEKPGAWGCRQGKISSNGAAASRAAVLGQRSSPVPRLEGGAGVSMGLSL